MGALGRLFAWSFLLAIVIYVVFSILTGPGLESPTGNIVAAPSEAQNVQVLEFPDCMDTDGGKNYDVLGHTYNTYDNGVYDDYCDGDNTLVEYFCNNQYPDRLNIPCECFKGACI